ncbi:type-1 angiotensin II receptor-associated protein [Scaptodrosophila lebanonensis]|uniref:Type-1 angiotensin II receptor-associated protein n=1 Tax=Drosophila lebanonensis TaxID=7225 RepID=A0A6J2U1C2_DROLE|nr:type-1 angiotensin II receptor-associated protein [Scaptodrosophila lebanonensis]XP_030380936.1 type-1 angiotensin II receptor-associated protein [Scaptodrosophila lebanonensis]XP_030380937.1 type-1 angiotensin II receptor-associated protein [Scaptodrosophila lebanonensis]
MTDLNELMGSPFVRVKLVAFVHFFFITNAMLGSWGHGAYEFYNFLFIISMFWTMHSKDSIEAVQTALVINASSIFFDLVCIIVFFASMNGWAIAFAIINLMLRPISVALLYREFNTRGGSLQTGSVFPTGQQRSYQDIDRPTQPTPTNSQPGPNVASIF